MIDQKTNKRIRKNKKTRKTRKRGRTNNKKTKGAGGASEQEKDTFIKRLMKLNVFIRKATNEGTANANRKIDFDVRTFHDFYDYLNETDMYLKKILTDELLAFTDPLKYKTNQVELEGRTKIYPYEFGYKQEVKKVEDPIGRIPNPNPPKN